MSDMQVGWHFVADTLRDGGAVPPDGVVLRHSGPMVLCSSGFHASPTPFEALKYAPGLNLCLVHCGGKIVRGSGDDKDKFICSERTIVARMDAKPLLMYFARQQALSVIHLWDPPGVVLDYLMGNNAARAAAWDAAWDAASDADSDAARAAARAAAWDAASAAASAAARDEFNQLVYYAFEDYL